MKHIAIVLILLTVKSLSSQNNHRGIHVGLGTGSSLLRLEGGYTISKKFKIGALTERAPSLVKAPTYNAAYFRANFKENDLDIGPINGSFHGYIGLTAGQIKLKGETTEEIDLFGNKTTKVIPDQSITGYSGSFGIEMSYSKKAKRIIQFIEINIGRLPIGWLNYNLSTINTPTPTISSNYSWAAGIRFYL